MSFNALKYVEELGQAGFTDEQAKAQIRVLQDVVESDLATKRDIQEVKLDIQAVKRDIQEVKRDIQEVKLDIQKVKRDIRELELKLERSIRELELRIAERMTAMELTLTKRVGLIIVSTATALFGGLVAVAQFFRGG